MKIDLLQTQYHKFGLTYDFKTDRLAFCRLVQSSWGWSAFNFNNTYKAWVFSDPKIVEAFYQRFPEIEITEDAKKACGMLILEEVEESKTAKYIEELRKSMISDIKIEGLKMELYPFQKAGVDFLVKSGGRAILGDDPGLGKSAQTIGFILAENIERTLIVPPASMKYTWEAEVTKWSHLSAVVISSDTIIEEIPPETRVWVINYDILGRHLEALLKVKFGLLALDEAHFIKSPTAKRSKAVKALAKNIPKIIALTGTPVLNRPIEVYNILSIIDPKPWGSYFRFAARYAAAHQTRFGLDVSGASNLPELREKMKKYFLRRNKEEVLKELPDKVRVEIPVELNDEYDRMYNKAYNNFATFLKENKGKKDKEVAKALQAEKLTQLNFLREIVSNGKVQAAKEIIQSVVDSGQKILVFSSFNYPLDVLKEEFGDAAVMITGKTPNEERFEIVKSFQEDPGVRVFLGGIKSSGVGITLTQASTVLFIDYAWTPADHKQAEDRAHRIGNEHSSITIYSIHALYTIDDVMKKMQVKKRAVVASVLGEGEEQEEFNGMKMVLDEIEGKKGED